MSKVVIRQLKGIKELDFEIPDKSGVYLLVGKNGCGKSTLLTCLHRIGYSNAFREGLPSSENSNQVDQYAKTEITYVSSAGEVTYGRRRKRWIPSPYKQAKEVLDGFDFSSTVFAKADESRFRITADELAKGSLYDANSFVKDSMNDVFDTTKYSKLKQLSKGGRHSRDDPYLLPSGPGLYYSEKRFSSGELALLRLMTELQGLETGSLVLLDEAELALHPQSQRRLMCYLRQSAEDKDLIILVATHSTTLIANEAPDNIVLLREVSRGKIEVVRPCFPAEAMESVDVFNSVLGDYLILVEDEMAQAMWRAMCQRFFSELDNPPSFQYDVLPVGGFQETAKLAYRIRDMLPDHTTVKAVLDSDAFEVQSDAIRAIMEDDPLLVHDLGFTPELKALEIILSHKDELEDKWRGHFGKSLKSVLDSTQFQSHAGVKNPRKRAKKQFDDIVEGLINPAYQANADVVKYEVVLDVVNLMPLSDLSAKIRMICHK